MSIDRREFLRVSGLAAVAVLCLTAEKACGPSTGTPDESGDDRVYQCNDHAATVLYGRKAYEEFHEKHPNVICKRIK
jgi:hypothetical protein